jgi:hypothetical protein
MMLVRTEGMLTNSAICRNPRTGIIHVFFGGPSRCGSSKKNVADTLARIQSAPPERFCDKCFPNGKPDSFEEFSV